MFSKTYGYILRHPATRRGYWGIWYYSDRYRRVLEKLSKFCKNERITILDCGCGSGTYARYLDQMGCNCHYVGCDINATSLKSAYRGDNAEYVLCDIQQLPFRGGSVEVVLCSEVLEHLNSSYETLANICETVITALTVTFPEEQILTAFRDRHPEHVSEIDKEEIIELLRSMRFEVVETSQIFSSFIPCGILEFLGIPRNRLTEKLVSCVDSLLRKLVPSTLVPHKTILIEAKPLRKTSTSSKVTRLQPSKRMSRLSVRTTRDLSSRYREPSFFCPS